MLSIDDKNDVIMESGTNNSHGRNLCRVWKSLITQPTTPTRPPKHNVGYSKDARNAAIKNTAVL